MFSGFGPQGWWPARTSFEVAVGAILTQNAAWSNVEKAIANLESEGLLLPDAMRGVSEKRLARLIRPSGYFNIKAKKLKAFVNFMFDEFGGDLKAMREDGLKELRSKLLSVWGVGPETADSILLYALEKPSFVVDAYTKRLFCRLGVLDGSESYDEVKRLFEENLPKSVELYNEYHALIVEQCKRACLKSRPRCGECLLRAYCRFKPSSSPTRPRP